MKSTTRILFVLFALIATFVSACTGIAAAPSQSAPMGGIKPQDMPVEFTGIIESINGNQWVVNGQTITVDPAVVRDGPYQVGDTIKVEVNVQADGSVVVNRVEAPAPAVVVPSASPDASSTPDPVSSATPDPASTADPNAGGITFDNQGNEAFGAVDSISGNTIVIGGKTFQLANNAQVTSQIQAGAQVKIHFTLNADGTMTITEIQVWTGPQKIEDNSSNNSGSNVGSDDPANHDQNDDHGNDDHQEDDHSGGDDNSGSNSGNGS
jgi:hypothetical protein